MSSTVKKKKLSLANCFLKNEQIFSRRATYGVWLHYVLTHYAVLFQIGLKDDFDIQTNSPTSPNREIDVHKDGSLDGEGCQTSSQNNCEKMRHCKEDEDIPGERNAGFCSPAKLGAVKTNIFAQNDVMQGELGSSVDRISLSRKLTCTYYFSIRNDA